MWRPCFYVILVPVACFFPVCASARAHQPLSIDFSPMWLVNAGKMTASSLGAKDGDAMSGPGKAYLDGALDLLQQYDLYRKNVDWKIFRHHILEYAKNAQTPQQVYSAIVLACTELKFSCELQEPENTPAQIQMQSTAIRTAAEAALHGKLLTMPSPLPFLDRTSFKLSLLAVNNRRYVYLVVPRSRDFHTAYQDSRLRHEWAEDLNRAVSEGISLNPEGWIIDLRGDRNGYTAPPLAGLQSLLGNVTVLTFQNPANRYKTFIENGAVMSQVHGSTSYIEEKIDEPVNFSPSTQPTAILIDRGTEGIGEILAIAFKGRKKTTFIGKHTGGATDQGATWDLPDGAVLTIVTNQTFDRNGRAYPEGIEPDISVDGPPKITTVSRDPVVLKAEEWLETQK